MKLSECLIIAFLFTSASRAATLPASEDSYGYRSKLTLAANNASALPVDATHHAFIWFNLADIQPGATLRYARLRLYLPRVIRAGAGMSVHRVTDSWDESLASNEPAFDATPIGVLPTVGLGTKRFISVDVTPTVQAWLTTPASNEGFVISAVAGASAKLTASVLLGAKEGAGSGYPAELDVEFTDSSIAPGAVGTSQIAVGAVQASNIASGAVNTATLADGSVTTPKIAGAAVTDDKIVAVSGSKVSGVVANAANSTTVNGIGVSTIPTANMLLPLDGTGKVPNSAVPVASGSALMLSSSDVVPLGYVDSGARFANWSVKMAPQDGPNIGDQGTLSSIGNRLFMALNGRVQEFDVIANEWNHPEIQIAPLGALAAVDDAGLIYYFGGTDAFGNQKKTVLSYNPQTGTLSSLPDMPTTVIPRRVVYLNGHFYFLSQSDCRDYNIVTREWLTFPLPPDFVYDAVTNGGKIYAISYTTLFVITPGEASWASVILPINAIFRVLPFSNSELLFIYTESSNPNVFRYSQNQQTFTADFPFPVNIPASAIAARFVDEIIVFGPNSSRQIIRAPLSSFRSLYIKTQ